MKNVIYLLRKKRLLYTATAINKINKMKK
ncbi:hypothetical protein BPO_0052 [Bergeyella porcorum]|uniref:Uncharacterized protein n=1 Tax=Bergeyella porcorum TaxID=1735111 RepID=A0AAU0EYL8_9FLAO